MEHELDRGMHFPTGWDPYFNDYMTLRDVYHYPTQHYDHHRPQLTITAATGTKQTRSREPQPVRTSVEAELVGAGGVCPRVPKPC